MAVLEALVVVPLTVPTKVVAVTVPLTSRAVVGAVVPTPTLPLVRIVKPLAAVFVLDWKRARVPVIPVLLLITLSSPVLVFIEELVVEILSPVPEVNALAVIVSASPVVVLATSDLALPVPLKVWVKVPAPEVITRF